MDGIGQEMASRETISPNGSNGLETLDSMWLFSPWHLSTEPSAAYEWFKTVEGLPFGYHNFLFGWVDTPDKSYPP